MSNPKLSIAQRLSVAELAIANSLSDPEIASLVAAFGYSADRLQAGKAFYEAALRAVHSARAAAGAQQASTEELKEAQREAHAAYQDLAKTARAVFQEDKARLTALGLTGRMPVATADFLNAAHTLFTNAAEIPILMQYGYSPEKLEREHGRVNAYQQADLKQEAAKGAAQQATREQEKALNEMDTWRAQYLKIARVALRSKPQLLEKLGIQVRSAKTDTQRDE